MDFAMSDYQAVKNQTPCLETTGYLQPFLQR